MVRIPESKIAVPELPHWFTPRPRSWRRLEAADAEQLVAVIAPAGSGKTTLLADWAHHSSAMRTAWVALDPDDADPHRLWSAVIASLLATGTVSADSGLHGLRRRVVDIPGAQDGEELTDELLDALDEHRPPVRLVLDDVHAVTGGRAGADLLARLLRRRPAGVRLVVAGRSDPPVGMPRLRMDDLLCELRAEDLQFALVDAAALLRSSDVDLAPEHVAVLHRRTDGWAAGLRLAALALRRSEDRESLIDRFSGDERSVTDYLTGEVLSGLSIHTRALLQDLSVCGRLPLALAVKLAGRTDTAHEVEELGRELAMVQRVAPTEYRLHALLRSHLEADLERHRPARHRHLHAVAARWWAERHEAPHALRHAERAGDPELTAELVRRLGVRLLIEGQGPPLRHALSTIEPRRLEEDPRLALVGALAHLVAGELPAAAADLRLARSAWPADREPALEALHAGTELIAAALGASPDRTDLPPTDGPVEPDLEALLHTARAVDALGAPTHGDGAAARVAIDHALGSARAHGFSYLEVTVLALSAFAAALAGDQRATTRAAQDAVDAAAGSGRDATAWAARATALAAYADLIQGHPDRADARCVAVLGAGHPLPEDAEYALHVVHGSATFDQGNPVAGLAEARAARTALGVGSLPSAAARALAVLEHRMALGLGNHRAAVDVAAWLTARTGEVPEAALMRACALAVSDQYEAAQALATPLRESRSLLRAHRLELHLLEAEAALQAGDEAMGRAALDAAVAEGRTLDVVRSFAMAGPRSRALLRARDGRPRTPFAGRIAAACATVPADATHPLSERELIVLALLPSLLNTSAMADELIVSVNTVKTQLRSIYAKLGVSTRREAVSCAHERGLLV